MLSDLLAPGLLLAAPPLGDPNFAKAVVLLASHGEEGSLGWVVNGSEIASVSHLLRESGLTPETVELPKTPSYAKKVCVGGPVSPRSAWLLYRRQEKLGGESEIVLSERWAASGDRAVIEAVARAEGPEEFRLLLGYAGWAPTQLDHEISVGAWMPATFDEALVFGDTTEGMWEAAYHQLIGVSPFAFTGLRPGSA